VDREAVFGGCNTHACGTADGIGKSKEDDAAKQEANPTKISQQQPDEDHNDAV